MPFTFSPARRGAARRVVPALALAAVVTLGISVAAPTDAASAASPSTGTYSAETGVPAVAVGSADMSDRSRPVGRLYISPRYLDRQYAGGPAQAATDVCLSYHLGNQCFSSLTQLLQSDRAKEVDCQVHGMNAVIPDIQYSRCRKS
jgi:hypothetical protein